MTSKVRKANKLGAAEIAQHLTNAIDDAPTNFSLEVRTANDLSENDKNQIWDLFASNMRHIYEGSSFGWDPLSKRGELFDPMSRFILVHRTERESSSVEPLQPPVIAYTMFRFDREAGESVVYCYELQVAASAQRARLGQNLMMQLENIGRGCAMTKVMLTMQKGNTAASKFYERIGFTLDPTSPEYDTDEPDGDGWVDEDDECDYRILSKSIM